MAATGASTVAPAPAAPGMPLAQLAALGVMVVFLLVAPLGLYPILLMQVMCFALFACAFNLLIGYVGLLSFGHAAYFGMASYVCAYLAKNGIAFSGIRILGLVIPLNGNLPPFTPELAILAGTATAAALGLAFGAREWVAFAVLRWWPRDPKLPRTPVNEPLHFPEVARTTAVVGRRMLTYRLTKSLLAPFGPIGNIAARTGRGLKVHQKLEPYIPHHFGSFLLFSLVTFGIAVFLALRSGEPAAMIAAAGLAQISAASANVLLLWRYLPSRDAEIIEDDDDDDE